MFRGSPVLYRDHRKGPGGPSGGAAYPSGPHGLKWEGNQPLVGWCAPLGPPAPRVGNPRGGGASTWLGGQVSPLAAAPPWRLHLLGPAPPQGGLYKGGEGSRTHALGASLSPCYTSPSHRSSAKLCRDHCCIHHHTVVLLDLRQPLLPPCWIKKE